MMAELELKDGRLVLRTDYVAAKARDLQTSGYDVTEVEVADALDMILAGEGWTSIIGAFIQGDLAWEQELQAPPAAGEGEE